MKLNAGTIILYRPVGPAELKLIADSRWKASPPRLPEQRRFYLSSMRLMLPRSRADWNTEASGSGYVTRFEVRSEFLAKYPVQVVGNSTHQELWIPAADLLQQLNENIIGKIEVIAEFHASGK